MASTSGPSKTDIEAVFHRLRAQSTNKVQNWIGRSFAYTKLHTPSHTHTHAVLHYIEQFQNCSFSPVNKPVNKTSIIILLVFSSSLIADMF